MEEDTGAVEEEPGDGQADDGGEVDGLAEAGAGELIVDGVEEVDELVLGKLAEAAGADFDGLGCGCGGGVAGGIAVLVALLAGSGRVGGEFQDRHRRSGYRHGLGRKHSSGRDWAGSAHFYLLSIETVCAVHLLRPRVSELRPNAEISSPLTVGATIPKREETLDVR
jgi:hypothetical protein